MELYQKIETYLDRTVDFENEVKLESEESIREEIPDDTPELERNKDGKIICFIETIKEWTIADKPKPTEAELEAITEYINPRAAEEARAERDRLIAATDWTQMTDVNLTDEKKEEYRIYRQSLRDISKQDGFPHNIIWAKKP